MKILIVEDEPSLREIMYRALVQEHYVVETAATYADADAKVAGYSYDCILLDIMLPDGNGLRLLEHIKELRKRENVIIISARNSLEDKVLGLEQGADDYLPKPFHTAELLARIHARFRIAKPAAEDGATGGASGGNANVNHLERGSIVIDRLEHTATKDGKDLNLTPMEFELLFMLAAAAGEAISRSSLLKNVWGYENSGDTRLVNVHVQRLRAKVEDDPENPQIVQTVRGIGYKFVTPEQ